MILFRHNLMRAEFLLFDTGESNPHKSLDESNGEEGEVERLVCFDHSKQRLQAAEKAKEEVAVMAFDVDADADGWSCERNSHVLKRNQVFPSSTLVYLIIMLDAINVQVGKNSNFG